MSDELTEDRWSWDNPPTRSVLIVPTQKHEAELLGPGMCGAMVPTAIEYVHKSGPCWHPGGRQPWSLFCGKASLPAGIPDGRRNRRALVLAWEGKVSPIGVARMRTFLGIEGLPQALVHQAVERAAFAGDARYMSSWSSYGEVIVIDPFYDGALPGEALGTTS